MRVALVVGNSDGIGLQLTAALLERGWQVAGISRSPSSIESAHYQHYVLDVCAEDYSMRLDAIVAQLGKLALCVYCVGIGEFLDLTTMAAESLVVRTNLLGAVITAQAVVPGMVGRGSGHFIGLSSQADRLIDAAAPSYAASKAGLSSYLEGLALACRAHGVYVTNVRFGFIATKMAKSAHKPFLRSPAHSALQFPKATRARSGRGAVQRILRCLETRPMRHTYPKRIAILLWVLVIVRGVGRLFSR